MSETKELTFQEIAEHNTKKDLYLIVHDKVYDCSSFVDEHPYVTPIPISVATLLPSVCPYPIPPSPYSPSHRDSEEAEAEGKGGTKTPQPIFAPYDRINPSIT